MWRGTSNEGRNDILQSFFEVWCLNFHIKNSHLESKDNNTKLKMSGGGKRNMVSDMLFKVIIVGDSGVGKTNLLTYFCEGVFKDSYVATIGVDFKIKMLQID